MQFKRKITINNKYIIIINLLSLRKGLSISVERLHYSAYIVKINLFHYIISRGSVFDLPRKSALCRHLMPKMAKRQARVRIIIVIPF